MEQIVTQIHLKIPVLLQKNSRENNIPIYTYLLRKKKILNFNEKISGNHLQRGRKKKKKIKKLFSEPKEQKIPFFYIFLKHCVFGALHS